MPLRSSGPVCFAAVACACACACSTPSTPGASGQPEPVLPPTKLAALAGPLYAPAPGQSNIGFYGTDLGITFVHRGELRILFGDTWADSVATPIGQTGDDAQGAVAMTGAGGLPDGDAVDAYVFAHPPAAGQLSWQNGGPPVVFRENDAGKVASIEVLRGGPSGASLDMGLGKVVVTAFSNARDGAFAIFRRDVAIACDGGSPPSCQTGFTCDTEMGFCSNTSGEFATPCVFGTSRCGSGNTCAPATGGGICQDRTSSMYQADDEDGRLDSIVIQQEVGNADPSISERYYTEPWLTNKFENPIAKTVEDFDPNRTDPGGNDYRPADGSRPSSEKVFVWGRPHSVGNASAGRDSRLYFGYTEMPDYSATGAIAWTLHYFSGLEGATPTFSDDPSAARALDLSGTPVPEKEAFDIVDKMSVSYVAPLDRWVMFYGGDLAPFVLNLFVGPTYGEIVRDPKGAIHARFAKDPWGPWTAPVPVFEAGDPSADPPIAGSEYAPGGVLHHPDCSGTNCAPSSPAPGYLVTPYGFLYTPNIIDAWTEPREGGTAADVYWNVSTWNPYETVLLRTRLRY